MHFSLALLAGAAMVAAQVPTGLPACGQTCVNNMLTIAASEFGCAAGNTTCYCSDPRFGYGLRDCSIQACGEAVYSQVLSYGTSVCAGLGVSTSGAATAIATSPTANGTTGAAGSSIPYTTSPVVTTISSDNSAVATSTIGSTTLYTPVGGVISSASAAASSAASSLSSAVSSAASAASSVASSVASSATNAASSATSSAFAAKMTAAPMLGGAALAALLMI